MASKVKKAQEPSSPFSIGVTDINVVETTFKWVVNNFSFYQTGFKNKLNSPVFETTNNKTITWCINLDPSTSKKFNNLIVNLKLVESSLPKVDATFEFMIINKDGKPEKSTSTKSATFYKGTNKSSKILMSNGYFQKNIQRILPNDSLTILCKIKANLDQGATNTMKAKAVPKQKSKAQCLPNQTGAVPAAKTTNTVGSKQQIQAKAQLKNLIEAAAKMDIDDLPKLNSKTRTAAAASNTMSANVAANVYPPMNTTYAAYCMPPPSYQPGSATNVYPPRNTTYAAYSMPPPSYQPGSAANAYPTMNTTYAAHSIPPPSYQPGSAANVYPPMNTTYAAHSMPPPSYQPGSYQIPPFTSTPIQHKPNIVPSGSSAVPPPKSSTRSLYCHYCNYLLRNCICKCCKYCKLLLQYCKCVYCKICKFRVKECACKCCEYCGDDIEDCVCEYCCYCELHTEECECDTCEYCGSQMDECECLYCPDCDLHIDDCVCEDNYCTYCNGHYEICDCNYCPDCDCPEDDCECDEF